MVEKLKALKVKLKRWNKEVFRKVEENKKATLKRIALWDTVETQRPLSISEMEAKVEALEDFIRWALMEETTWR